MNSKISVVCVRQGQKYSKEYVIRLKNMVKRYLSSEFEFICFTDNLEEIYDDDIYLRELPKGIYSWWAKLFLFSNDACLQGTVLYLDLDTVICGNLKKIINYHLLNIDKIIAISNFADCDGFTIGAAKLYSLLKAHMSFSCCLMVWYNSNKTFIWEKFYSEKDYVLKSYISDSDFMSFNYKDIMKSLPTGWYLYYKKNRELVKDSSEYKNAFMNAKISIELEKLKEIDNEMFNKTISSELTVFKEKEYVSIKKDVILCIFSGYPKPHTVKDDFIVQNWK
jgi:hypothetical protein